MENQTQKWKPQGGFWLWLLVTLGFVAVDILGTQFLRDATAILLIDSLVRIGFGVLSVWLLVKYFDKGSWRNVIHVKNLDAALLAGGGMILLILMETIVLFTKTPTSYWQELRSVPWQLLFAELVCQQVTTGFFEEAADRALLMEGYYQNGERTGKRRLAYGLLSAVLFGAMHLLAGPTTAAFAALFGFAMTAIYLHSHNILVPMLLHFLQDLVAHTMGHETELAMMQTPLWWMAHAIMIAWAVAFLLLPEKSPLCVKGGSGEAAGGIAE